MENQYNLMISLGIAEAPRIGGHDIYVLDMTPNNLMGSFQ